jgi:hypothetical protein
MASNLETSFRQAIRVETAVDENRARNLNNQNLETPVGRIVERKVY